MIGRAGILSSYKGLQSMSPRQTRNWFVNLKLQGAFYSMATKSAFQQNAQVEHPKFGPGTVDTCDEQYIVIYFDDPEYSRKKFISSIVIPNLSKLDREPPAKKPRARKPRAKKATTKKAAAKTTKKAAAKTATKAAAKKTTKKAAKKAADA